MDYVLLDEKFARTAYPSIDARRVGMQFQIPESLWLKVESHNYGSFIGSGSLPQLHTLNFEMM